MYYQQHQQPMQQQMQPLPYPSDRLLSNPIGMDYGRPPFQVNVQVPPQLQQYLPLIVYEAINQIQMNTSTPIRVFFFNLMSDRQWQNQAFYSFVQRLAELVDLTMRTSGNQNINQVITNCAIIYTQYKLADSLNAYPALLVGMPQDVAMIASTTIQQFRNDTGRMEQALQQAQYGQQQQQPYGAPIGYQAPNSYQQPMAFQPQSQNPGFNRFNNQAPISPASPQPSGLYTSTTQYPQETNSRWDRFNTPPQTEDIKPIQANVTSIPTGTEVHHQTPSSRVGVIDASTIQRSQEPQPAPAAPAPQEPKAKAEYDEVLLATDPKAVWVRSERYPYSVAYDPNKSELYYAREGSDIKPIIVPKEQSAMDRVKHLAVPTITPAWSARIHQEQTQNSIEVPTPITEKEIEVTFKTDIMEPALCEQDHWTHAALREHAKADDEQHVVTTATSFIMEPTVMSEPAADMLNQVIGATTPQEAVDVLNKFIKTASGGSHAKVDMLAFQVIDKRLTARFNRFIKQELALTAGAIDSFYEDVPQLPDFLKQKFGNSVHNCFMENFSKLVGEALTYGATDLRKATYEYFFDDVKEEDLQAKGLALVSFYDTRNYATTDLSSIQLNLDIHVSRVSVGLLESQNPLLYKVAKAILDSGKGKVDISRLKSSDGVVYEFTYGALTKDFILVAKRN